jgi:hypothetical protein
LAFVAIALQHRAGVDRDGHRATGPLPVLSSYDLLARVGVSRAFAPALLYGAALMDLAFGVATVLIKRRRFVWLTQAAAMVHKAGFQLTSAWLRWSIALFSLVPLGYRWPGWSA